MKLKPAGLIPPVISPLTAAGEIDIDAVARITGRLLAAGVDGLFVLGSSGEGPTLSDSQRADVVQAYRHEVKGQIPLYVGIPDPSSNRATKAMTMAIELGATSVVIGAPYYYSGASPLHVRDHVLRTAADWDVPIILYNIPQATGNAFTPNVISELASDPRVVAIKDSCAVPQQSAELQRAAQGAGIAFLQGAEALIVESLDRGAAGIIPGVSNIVPGLSRRLLDAQASGERTLADQLQLALVKACDIVYRDGHWLAALKATAASLNLCSPFTSADVPAVDRGMASMEEELSVLTSEFVTAPLI